MHTQIIDIFPDFRNSMSAGQNEFIMVLVDCKKSLNQIEKYFASQTSILVKQKMLEISVLDPDPDPHQETLIWIRVQKKIVINSHTNQPKL